MKINEVLIPDPTGRLFDEMKNQSSRNIYNMLNHIKYCTNNFQSSAAECISRDEIGEILSELNIFERTSVFSDTDQVTSVMSSIRKYLQE